MYLTNSDAFEWWIWSFQFLMYFWVHKACFNLQRVLRSIKFLNCFNPLIHTFFLSFWHLWSLFFFFFFNHPLHLWILSYWTWRFLPFLLVHELWCILTVALNPWGLAFFSSGSIVGLQGVFQFSRSSGGVKHFPVSKGPGFIISQVKRCMGC